MGTRSRQQPSSVSYYATARRFPRTNERVSSWSDLGLVDIDGNDPSECKHVRVTAGTVSLTV